MKRIRDKTETKKPKGNTMKNTNKNKETEYHTVQIPWVDMMAHWMDTLEQHLMDSAHEPKEYLGGLSLADYVKKQVWIVADATDRANAVAREQEKNN
mgnify:CR=1 FL=1